MHAHLKFLRVLPFIFAFFTASLFMHLSEVTLARSLFTFGTDQSFADLLAELVFYVASVLKLEKLFRKQLKKVFIANMCSYFLDYYVKFRKI